MAVFISYRREDSEGDTRALYERLSKETDKKNLFLDFEAISAGDNWRKRIDEALDNVQAVVVVIGPRWLETLMQRLSAGSADLVRREIAMSLAKPMVRVIPVLVKGATMPSPYDLPDDIRSLADRDGLEIHGSSWNLDVHELIKILHQAKSLPVSRNTLLKRGIFTFLVAGFMIAVTGFFVLVKVPKVPLNMSYKYAKELIESHGLKFQAVKRQDSEEEVIDIVGGQRPTAGAYLFRGQSVEVNLIPKELYHLVCRGGGMLGKPTDDDTLVFEKHGDSASFQMGKGTCAWRDRGLRESETPVIKPLGFMRELLLAFEQSPGGYVELCAFSDYPQPITDVTRSIQLLALSFDAATTLDGDGQVQWKTNGIYCKDQYRPEK